MRIKAGGITDKALGMRTVLPIVCISLIGHVKKVLALNY